MSDFDLVKIDKTESKFDKFTTMLQVKYGYTRDQAKKEIIKHIAEFDVDKKDRIKPAWYDWLPTPGVSHLSETHWNTVIRIQVV